MPLWNEIEGKTLNGLPLRRLLRSEGRTAWFATEDAAGQPAVLIVFEALNDEDAVENRLKTAASLQHSNLLAIRSTGRGRLDDESLVYAVMEPFDQTLAEVLQERTLAPEEVHEVVESLLSGLSAVEGAGLYHGHVDASGVLGVGDRIKLRSDCLRPRANQSDAPALAALTYQAMTGRRLGSESDAVQLAAPFGTLVRAGAGASGSLAAMRRVLDGGPAAASTASAPAAPSRAPAAPPRPILETEPEARPRRRGITIAALVIMAIVLAVLWHTLKRPERHTPISGEALSTTPSQSPAVAADASPAPANTQAEQPAPAKSAPATPTATRPIVAKPATPAATVSQEGGVRTQWRVIVYTYDKQEAAEHKATELAVKFPQFDPQVFTPNGHAPYLVSLGTGMSRHDAFMRREAARAAGLPSDTYMQNYRE